MAKDVLFIHPGGQKRTYQELSKNLTAIAPPVWTPLLANATRKDGHDSAIYDVNVEGWDSSVPAELIMRYNPRLIVMMVYGHNPSASTQTMPAARNIARDIKTYNKDIPIAIGGIHPSALPRRTLCEEPVDFVIQGEGVYTINSLARYLSGRCRIEDVQGLWYRKNDSIQFTAPSPLVENLDTVLDGYAWDLLPSLTKYRAHNMHCFQYFEQSSTGNFSDVRSPYVAMNTSLGCPYSCHYCSINAIFGRPGIRYWSLDKVLSWIDTLVNRHGVKHIRFDDELFILSPKRVERFCDMVIERGYDLNLWVYGRVDTIREDLLKKMKRAGINWICLGIESASEKVRTDVNKSIRRNIGDIVRQIQNSGIYVLGNYMFGLPEDDLTTLQETLDLAMELNCEFANFYTVMALPGSALYEDYAKKDGDEATAWERFSQHGFDTQPMSTKYLSPADVLTFRDAAFNIYFSNDKYLEIVEKKFGKRTRQHIEEMLTIKIKRKLVPCDQKVSRAIEQMYSSIKAKSI